GMGVGGGLGSGCSSFMGPQDGTYRLLTAAAVRLDISWPVVLPPASQQESSAWMMGADVHQCALELSAFRGENRLLRL
ncbi:hypothetical protein C3L32_33855, partial [Pseudomonas aeruginosa]